MATKTYSDKLKDPRWQKKRLEIMERDKFTCQCCGDTTTELHVHHKKYTAKNIWDEPNDNLSLICKHCHFIKHHMINSDEYDFNVQEVTEYNIKKIIGDDRYYWIIFHANSKTYIGVLDDDNVKLFFTMIDTLYDIEVINLVKFYNEKSELYDRMDTNS